MKHQTSTSLCLLFCLMSHSTLAEETRWQSNHYLEDSFVRIALGREYGPARTRLNKWAQDIHFYIGDNTADKVLHQKMVTQQLAHLASITGLSFSPSQTKRTANLQIVFSSEKNLDELMQSDFRINNQSFRSDLNHHGVCFANITTNGDTITHARVIIPVDRARAHAKLMACVVEELTQVMGLANDSDQVFPSVFNDRSYNDFLTGLDLVLLKLLYHPVLRVGMSELEVRKAIKALLNTAEFIELINNAEQQVRVNSLENWLD